MTTPPVKSASHRLAWALAASAVVVAGGLSWQLAARAPAERRAAAPEVALLPRTDADAAAAPGAAADMTRVVLTDEQRRLKRYDKDADGSVSREEYLASRRKAFAKLDVNGDGVLSFDESAARTLAKFSTADANRDARLSALEFATTAVKRKAARDAPCPPDSAAGSAGEAAN